MTIIEQLKRELIKKFNNCNISKATIAEQLNIYPQEMTRIFDINHNTKIDVIEKVFNELGYTISFKISKKKKKII